STITLHSQPAVLVLQSTRYSSKTCPRSHSMIRPLSLSAVCLAFFLGLALPIPSIGDDWPPWRGPKRDGVWREPGIVEKFSEPQLPIQWRVPVGPGYNGPTMADGRVYVMDRQLEPKQSERVLCVDAKTGNEIWSHTYGCVYKGVGYQAGPRAAVTI